MKHSAEVIDQLEFLKEDLAGADIPHHQRLVAVHQVDRLIALSEAGNLTASNLLDVLEPLMKIKATMERANLLSSIVPLPESKPAPARSSTKQG